MIKVGKGYSSTFILLIFVILALVAIVMIWSRPTENYKNSILTEEIGTGTEEPSEKEKTLEVNQEKTHYRSMTRSIVISIILLVLLLIIARFMKKNVAPSMTGIPDFQILGKKYLDQNHAVMLAKSYGKYLLMSMSDSQINLIREISPEDIPEVEDLSHENNEMGGYRIK